MKKTYNKKSAEDFFYHSDIVRGTAREFVDYFMKNDDDIEIAKEFLGHLDELCYMLEIRRDELKELCSRHKNT